MTAVCTPWTCTICGNPAGICDGIVGAYLCDSEACLLAAYGRRAGERAPDAPSPDQTITADSSTRGLVASRRGVRVDTETGWSSPVAYTPEDCEQFAAAFTAMADRLRQRPDVVEEWDRLADLDVGDAQRDDIPEAMVRADEREQLAEAGRLLPDGSTITVEASIDWTDDRAAHSRHVHGIDYSWPAGEFDTRLAREVAAARRLHRVPLDGRRRTVTEFPDGSVVTGPWTAFEVTP
ncbi:hypothetical protein AB0B63_06800 [Micromonospora sp. NPDC049081]|uniref:hypothetical protein n=1 Tax=Micromonospora sp. NPDC049081 TaxID=3155150 RepID=UPI003411DF24